MTERNGSVRGPAVTKMAKETGMHMPHLFGSVFGAKNRARPSCFPYISHDSHEQKATRNPIPIAKYDAEQTAAHFTHVPMNTLTHATTHAQNRRVLGGRIGSEQAAGFSGASASVAKMQLYTNKHRHGLVSSLEGGVIR